MSQFYSGHPLNHSLITPGWGRGGGVLNSHTDLEDQVSHGPSTHASLPAHGHSWHPHVALCHHFIDTFQSDHFGFHDGICNCIEIWKRNNTSDSWHCTRFKSHKEIIEYKHQTGSSSSLLHNWTFHFDTVMELWEGQESYPKYFTSSIFT